MVVKSQPARIRSNWATANPKSRQRNCLGSRQLIGVVGPTRPIHLDVLIHPYHLLHPGAIIQRPLLCSFLLDYLMHNNGIFLH